MSESIKESLMAIMPGNSRDFGAYSAKGNNAMRTIARALVRDLIKLEEAGNTMVSKKLMVAEKSLIKYSKKADELASEGIADSDSRDQLYDFIADALKTADVTPDLVREFEISVT